MKKKYNLYYYNALKSCISENSFDETKWFKIRVVKEKDEKINLSGAYFGGDCLKGATLSGVDFTDTILHRADLRGAHLDGATLIKTQLHHAKLQNTMCDYSNFTGAYFYGACLNDAFCFKSDFTDANFTGADLTGVDFKDSDLSKANFTRAILKGTKLETYKTNEAIFDSCHLYLDTEIKSTDIGIFSSGAKQTIEYINRRRNWEEWYNEHDLLQIITRPFWFCSNYGRSFPRIALIFFVFSFLFALIYSTNPTILEGLIPEECGLFQTGEVLEKKCIAEELPTCMLFYRAFYFSIVTMTTLGFGDIHASSTSWLGTTLLIIQVILGYVILGALITRLSVLFSSDGPAQKLEDEPGFLKDFKEMSFGMIRNIKEFFIEEKEMLISLSLKAFLAISYFSYMIFATYVCFFT
ncbi:MAG: hypothetical protein GY760_23480 [Deltaproteobacteria bacterium]|nr:hypothetical protein [Deltaproteobacteria bacterium]